MHTPNKQLTHRILYSILTYVERYKIAAIGTLLVVVFMAGSQLTNFTFDNTADAFFMQGDSNLANYEEFKEHYQSDEFSLILVKAPGVWDKIFINDIKKVTTTLEKIKHVSRVASITNVRNIEGKDDEIVIDDLFSEEYTNEEIKERQRKAIIHPHYSNLYVTKNGKHVAIVIETEILKNNADYKISLVNNLREVLNSAPLKKYNPRIVGLPILDSDVRTIVQKESVILSVLCFTLIIVGFWIVFRSIYTMIMGFVIISSSLVITFGMMASLGYSYTVLTPIVPTFLMSVGIGSLMFLLTGFCYNRDKGMDGIDALTTTVTKTGSTCCMTVLTTSSALFAFSASDIVPVFQVGITMGLGLIVTFVITLFWFPIFLGPKSQHHLKLGGIALNSRINVLMLIGEWVILHYRKLLLTFVTLCAIALIGLSQLKTDYQYLDIFKPSTQIHKDYTYVDNLLPTSASIELVFKGSEKNAIKKPDILKAMDKLSIFIAKNSELPVKIYSLADVVKELNQAFHNNDQNYYRIPDNQALIAQELFLFESGDQSEFLQLVSWNYQQARMIIRVPNVADSQYRKLLETIDTGINEEFKSIGLISTAITNNDRAVKTNEPKDNARITVIQTGLVQLWVTIGNYLIESQVSSVLLAFGAVTLAMMVIFKSILLGCVFGLLNLSVVVIVLGIMGGLNIYLDPYTVLIAGIALGILDDDTIHFVKSVQENINSGSTIETALRRTYAQAGQAIFYTTAILVASFSINLFSSIASLTKFGLLVSLTLILGLIVEFLITPGLILLFRSRFLNQNEKSIANEYTPLPLEKEA